MSKPKITLQYPVWVHVDGPDFPEGTKLQALPCDTCGDYYSISGFWDNCPSCNPDTCWKDG